MEGWLRLSFAACFFNQFAQTAFRSCGCVAMDEVLTCSFVEFLDSQAKGSLHFVGIAFLDRFANLTQ